VPPVALAWVHEDTPRWDADKARTLGAVAPGSIEIPMLAPGDLAPGEWFRVERDGAIVGYGWMDCTWGDAEILLAVPPDEGGAGIGTFILDRLEHEAAARGVNYLYNAVKPSHPEGEAITRWLVGRGFQPSGDGLLKRRVRRS
jgi:N-acetylglutamate synthase-like GNAT family acetyltransferase